LAETDQSLSDLKARYTIYSMVKSKIELSNEINLMELKAQLAKSFPNPVFNMEDGLKMDLKNGWVHLRKSNTEPIIRIYSEANTTPEAEGLVDKVKQIIHESI